MAASAGGKLEAFTLDADEIARLTDPVPQVGVEDSLSAAAFNADLQFLALTDSAGRLAVWHLYGSRVLGVRLGSAIADLALDPAGRLLAVAFRRGSEPPRNPLEIWDVSRARPIPLFLDEEVSKASRLAFDADGRRLAVGTEMGQLVVFEPYEDGWRSAGSIPLEGPAAALAFSADSQLLAIAGRGAVDRGGRIVPSSVEVQILNFITGSRVATIRPDGEVLGLAWGPDDALLATAQGSMARVWDPRSGAERARVVVDERRASGAGEKVFATTPGISHVAFDGSLLLTATDDGQARLWRLPDDPYSPPLLPDQPNTETSVATPSPSGYYVVVRDGPEAEGRLWSLRGYQPVLAGEELRAFAFHRDGVHFLSAGAGGFDLWRLPTGEGEVERQAIHPGPERAITHLALSSDGQQLLLAVAGDSTTEASLIVTELPDLTRARRLADLARDIGGRIGFPKRIPLPEAPLAIAITEVPETFSVSTLIGRVRIAETNTTTLVAAATGPGTIRIWGGESELWSATLLDPGESGPEPVRALAFSRDGYLLAGGGEDGTVCVWETVEGRKEWCVSHGQHVHGVAFGGGSVPRDDYLLSGSDARVMIWNAASGRQVGEIPFPEPLKGFALGPLWAQLIAAIWGRAPSRFLWRPTDLRGEACSRVTRQLTPEEWRQHLPDKPYDPTCRKVAPISGRQEE